MLSPTDKHTVSEKKTKNISVFDLNKNVCHVTQFFNLMFFNIVGSLIIKGDFESLIIRRLLFPFFFNQFSNSWMWN